MCTKLIHGGVRYLQKAIMKLDYKQVNASFFLPIALMQSDRDRCDISVPTHFHTTSHRLGVTHIPLLWSCPPAAGQHNDARMNLAIALTAARYGAAIANYTEVVHLLKRADPQTGKERVCEVHCRDVITGQEFDVRAKCVINATGPFTDAPRKMDDQKNPDICQPSAGVPTRLCPPLPSRPKVNAVVLFVPLLPMHPPMNITHTNLRCQQQETPGPHRISLLRHWKRMLEHTRTQQVIHVEKGINFSLTTA
uniref:glycerol-3-phosphate dehydrogenase n=1 Tax=Sphaeramia orbicularis TaxID=375764 RepID=A0A673CY35_9TELE